MKVRQYTNKTAVGDVVVLVFFLILLKKLSSFFACEVCSFSFSSTSFVLDKKKFKKKVHFSGRIFIVREDMRGDFSKFSIA